MDLKFDDERTRKFATNVGLLTSNGPFGHNIMSCEWTHHVSYSPALIAVCVNPKHSTHDNIKSSKEFGISICSEDQNIISSIAGNTSGRMVNKFDALKELGFEFYKAEHMDVWMVKGASMNAECRLFKEIQLGDHTMFVGEILELTATQKQPLLYFNGKYWKMGEKVQKPQQVTLDKINAIVEKHRKKLS